MKKSLSLLALVLILLAGCQSAPETAAAPAPTRVKPTSAPKKPPTPSATQQPPLKEYEWSPRPVLLRLDLLRKADEILNPPAPSQFILYADGGVFITRPAIAGYPHGDQQLLFKQMERAEVCRVLNTLDQTGFLDYDPSDYSGGGGLYDVYFEVNAWKSRKGTYPGLPLRVFNELTGMDNGDGFPALSPALSRAYALALDYPLEGFKPYQPERIGVWIRPLNPADYPNIQWKNWAFSALTISYMYSKIDYGGAGFDERYMVLRKQGAANLYEYLKESFSTQYYVETGRLGEKTYYAVYARPLLPYELPGGFEMETPPAAPKLKCHPSDGVMEIPQPNLIYALPIP